MKYEGKYFSGIIDDTNIGTVLVSVITMSGPIDWK